MSVIASRVRDRSDDAALDRLDNFALTFGVRRGLPAALEDARPSWTTHPRVTAGLASRAITRINALLPAEARLGSPETREHFLRELERSPLVGRDLHWMDWLNHAREKADLAQADAGLTLLFALTCALATDTARARSLTSATSHQGSLSLSEFKQETQTLFVPLVKSSYYEWVPQEHKRSPQVVAWLEYSARI